ncbi:MAG: hypothetical protein KAU31_11215, partial [Spirochaetaceae bacterium]|nr:hypothetical protein [Spirochaetaceae bacterium]
IGRHGISPIRYTLPPPGASLTDLLPIPPPGDLRQGSALRRSTPALRPLIQTVNSIDQPAVRGKKGLRPGKKLPAERFYSSIPHWVLWEDAAHGSLALTTDHEGQTM